MTDQSKSAIRAARNWRLTYLASPYRAHPRGQWPAVVEASQAAAKLMRLGVHLFCPISHGWPISQYGGIDGTNNEFWSAANRPMVDACDGLLVLTLPGWESSEGITEEVKAFGAAGKPIIHLNPGDLD